MQESTDVFDYRKIDRNSVMNDDGDRMGVHRHQKSADRKPTMMKGSSWWRNQVLDDPRLSCPPTAVNSLNKLQYLPHSVWRRADQIRHAPMSIAF